MIDFNSKAKQRSLIYFQILPKAEEPQPVIA